MPGLARALATALLGALRTRRHLVLENLALRHQLAVLAASGGRPRFRPADRLIWVCLRRLWNGWREVLVLVQPATVVRWHREGFRRYWERKSRRRPGRPRIDPELRSLIRKMATANPLWGAPRIHGEFEILGGLWILLISWAALRTGGLPRTLNYLGVVIGVAGTEPSRCE